MEPFGGNPSERLNPSFSPEAEEAGVPEELNPVVMAPPGFASPDPRTQAARLLPLEDSPLSADLADDYAKDEIAAGAETSLPDAGSADPTVGLPADRDEWEKAHWQVAAKHYGLSTKGSANDVKKRVESHEKELDKAGDKKAQDWKDEIDKIDDADELAELKAQYGESGSDYSSVVDAFDKKEAELADNNDNNA